nr:helix-turn-helix domain-containing protein [Paenibacillus sp. PL91]
MDKPLLDIKEAAEYLNLSEEQVILIINSEQSMLQSSGSFTGTMFPHFKIGSTIYISKSDLANWISDTTREKREYVDGTVLQ